MSKPPTPTISRILSDGTLVELTFDAGAGATALAVCPPTGTPSLVDRFAMPGGDLLVPYSAGNNLLGSGCVLLPAALGELGSKATLLVDLKSFIHRYVGLSDVFEDTGSVT